MKTANNLALVLAVSLAFTGCASFTTRLAGLKTAVTGQNATLTVEIVGVTVDALMKDAAKAYHTGDMTKTQWDKVAALHARYLPVFNAERLLIEATRSNTEHAPSAALLGLLADFKQLAESFAHPAPKKP